MLLSDALQCFYAIQICSHRQTYVCVRIIRLYRRLMPLLFFSDDCRWQVTCWCFVYCMHFHDAANYVTVKCLPHDAWFAHGTVLSHTVHSLLQRCNDNMKWLQPIGVVEKLKRERDRIRETKFRSAYYTFHKWWSKSNILMLNTLNNDMLVIYDPIFPKRTAKLNSVLATMQNCTH